MTAFCTDRDLLAIEPNAFLAGGFPVQTPASGSDGQLAGTAFSAASADFILAAAPGMVLVTHQGAPAEGAAWEVLSVDSATALTVSVLRAEPDAAAVPPPAASETSWALRTFAAQIAAASETLSEKLRRASEAAGISSAEFADSAQLRRATAHAALARIFAARADGPDARDANWIKAEHHRRTFDRLQLQLRLAVDADGDGLAEQTRTLGQVRLRRV